MKHIIIFTLIFTIGALQETTSSDVSSLLETMEELEKRLEDMIIKESRDRKKENQSLKKLISEKKPLKSSSKPNEAIQKSVGELKQALIDVRSSQKKLNKKLVAIMDSLQNFSKKGDDERVSQMAKGLKKLIADLREAMNITEEEQEAMELGGLVTLDYGMDVAEPKKPVMQMGKVGLSAVVNISSYIKASIALLAERNMSKITIKQALVEWAPADKPVSVIAGLQRFNHGLLSTHIISDPLLLRLLETITPGVTLNFPVGPVIPGIGINIYHHEEEVESYVNDEGFVMDSQVVIQEEKYFVGAAVNLDAEFLEESNARLSMILRGEILDLAIGTGLVLGPASIDLEGYYEIMNDDELAASGFYAGFAYGITDEIEAALRYDGLSEDKFTDIEHRIGLGFSIGFKHDIFCAFEYAYGKPFEEDAVNEIGIQFGLESTIKLPGFQRKTLTRK